MKKVIIKPILISALLLTIIADSIIFSNNNVAENYNIENQSISLTQYNDLMNNLDSIQDIYCGGYLNNNSQLVVCVLNDDDKTKKKILNCLNNTSNVNFEVGNVILEDLNSTMDILNKEFITNNELLKDVSCFYTDETQDCIIIESTKPKNIDVNDIKLQLGINSNIKVIKSQGNAVLQ